MMLIIAIKTRVSLFKWNSVVATNCVFFLTFNIVHVNKPYRYNTFQLQWKIVAINTHDNKIQQS